MTPDIVRHLETHLGQIQEGWEKDSCGRGLPFQVVRLAHGPISETKALATLGLSNHALKSKASKKTIRCELVMIARDGSRSLPGTLQQVAMEMLQSQFALLRGEVLGPRGSLVEGSKMEALYISKPAYFPETFATCQSKKLGPVVFIWLVPISADEADFVRRNGWGAFEALLEARDPDLSDFFRESIISAE